MKTIKFRGKTNGGEWVFGSLLQWPDGKTMIYDTLLEDGSMGGHDVIPFTVSQCTGIKDAGERDIYEGDIVRIDGFPERGCLVVVFYEGSFALATLNEHELLLQGSHPFLNDYARLPELGLFDFQGLYRVVGNITDNPEMMAKEAKQIETMNARIKNRKK